MRQTVSNRSKGIIRALESTSKSEVTPSELQSLQDFTKASDETFTQAGKDLKARVLLSVRFYKSLRSSDAVETIVPKSGFMPGVDSFLDKFVEHYKTNPKFRSSLVVLLMKGYVAKVDGIKNPKYGTKVLNFMMALAASGDKKAFEYVSGNLCSCSLRWMKTLMTKKRTAPFIELTPAQIIDRITSNISKIRSSFANDSMRVAFTVGLDATCLVKGFQLSSSHGAIVGGIHPNHFISVNDRTPEEVKVLLKDCIDGKYGEAAPEIKVAVICFQRTPPTMCPYLVLVGQPQSINLNSTFGSMVISLCESAAEKSGNTVVLNQSTDGVSCEVEYNLDMICGYLQGKHDHTALPDTNHNIKNQRYQYIGGSSPASIGHYVFDSFMLVEAGVSKECIRIEDFASDALPMKLASTSTIRNLIACSFPDVGNCAVTIVSLAFMRLRSYSVNARKLDWKARAIYSWATLLWVTSFHTSGSTMMANKRNMLLESVGILFLVCRDDVHHPRRLTSECNEHTYGNWRMILREFNVEQLIRIVQKSMIKTNALFESQLVTSRSSTTFKGHQNTFPEYLAAMQADMSGAIAGPVHVTLDCTPAVTQLWNEVKGVIEVTNSFMLPFLKLFGVEVGNGLSPFATNIDTPDDLVIQLRQFFRPARRDARGATSFSLAVNNGADATSVDEEEDSVLDDDNDDDDDDTSSSGGVSTITNHAAEIQQLDVDNEEDEDDDVIVVSKEDEAATADKVENFFDSGASSDAYDMFKSLLGCGDITSVCDWALNLVELLQLGKMEKGALTAASKYNSRNGRWFGQKPKKDSLVEDGGDADLYIERDSMIQLTCKRGNTEAIENYRVLAFFTKYYNKWFVAMEKRFLWENDVSKHKNVRVLVRLMKKTGSNYHEVALEAGGDWNPKQVFCIKSFKDILNVGNVLVTM